MPELPEVQAHAERLTEAYAGRPAGPLPAHHVHRAQDGASRHRTRPTAIALEQIGRRGKYLLLEFAPLTFVVHLMQGGRLKEDEKQSLKPRGGQARWRFEDGRALLLTEAGTERRAGVWCVPAGQALRQSAHSVALGPEAMDVTPHELAARSPHSRCGSTPSCATSAASPARPPAGQRGVPPGQGVSLRVDRQAGPGGSAAGGGRHPRRGRRGPGLRTQPHRHELLGRPARRSPQAHRRGLPGVRRHRSGRSSTPATRSTTARRARPAARSWPTTPPAAS